MCSSESLTLLQPGLHWCLLPTDWVMVKIRSCIQAGRVSRQEHRENFHSSKRSSSFSRTEQQWRLTNRGFNLHTPTAISVCKLKTQEDANWISQTNSAKKNVFVRGSLRVLYHRKNLNWSKLQKDVRTSCSNLLFIPSLVMHAAVQALHGRAVPMHTSVFKL